MIGLLGALARPLLLAMEPEAAHRLTIKALATLPLPKAPRDPASLAIQAFGLNFPNPLGMAAGFDKNAEAYRGLQRLGFGFVEIGTVTPLPQVGNPRPRMFRLVEDGAVINRLGFNGGGHAAALARLKGRGPGIVGVNIGANKDARDRIADYVAGITAFAPVASYFTVNVSSPNTPGLRDLQAAQALDQLLARVVAARDEAAQNHGWRAIILKIAPDLTLAGLDDVVRVARARKVDAMIVANTTISRPLGLHNTALSGEAGGLSGRPLFTLSTSMLASTFQRVERQFPLIGVGGIACADTAYAKITAGATLLQLYTALIYEGAGLIGTIKHGLAQRLLRDGFTNVAQAVGTKVQ